MRSVPSLLTILILFIFCYATEVVVAAPYQVLPPRAGHIPVYIREGNQPLSEIHPGLAEAFNEVGQLEHTTKDSCPETPRSNDTPDRLEEDENAVDLTRSSPPESDIASFDAIKNDKNETLSKNENKKQKIGQEEEIIKKQDN